MNREETAKLLAVVRSIWANEPVTQQTVAAWTWALEDVDYASANAALGIWIRTAKFAPKPAELRALLAEAAISDGGWETAWAEVMACVKEHGIYVGDRWGNGGGTWSSPAIARALDHVGGYESVCCSELDNLPTIRAQFRNMYEAARKRQIDDVQRGQLVPIGELLRRRPVADGTQG